MSTYSRLIAGFSRLHPKSSRFRTAARSNFIDWPRKWVGALTAASSKAVQSVSTPTMKDCRPAPGGTIGCQTNAVTHVPAILKAEVKVINRSAPGFGPEPTRNHRFSEEAGRPDPPPDSLGRGAKNETKIRLTMAANGYSHRWAIFAKIYNLLRFARLPRG